MKRFRLMAFFLLAVMLTACFSPKTPQEATEAFWKAVVKESAAGAVRYSTLKAESEYDAFGQEWQGLKPSLGRVVIEGSKASVITAFTGSEGSEVRSVTTYLVQQDGEWKVDYSRTAAGMKGGLFSLFISELDRLGEQLTEHFGASSSNLQAEMEMMSDRLRALSETLDQKASESIGRYGEVLRRSIDDLAASARDALEEANNQLSEEEKRLLDDVASDLEEESDRLDEPDAGTIAKSSTNAAAAQGRLLTINKEALEQYKQKWQQWQKAFEENAQKFIDELNAALESPSEKKE